MRLSWRKWGVTSMAWLAVLTLGGVALAGAVSSSSEPAAWLSPAAAEDGKTIASAEPFEMTLHFQGDPNETYDVAVSYDGDGIGVCADDNGVLETNENGKATFACDFLAVDAGLTERNGTVTFTVSKDGETVTTTVASLTVAPVEVEEPEVEEPQPLEADGPTEPNHGQCVSYWSKQAKAEGLKGRHKGAFVSSIAKNPDAVALKGEPGEDCDFADDLAQALEDQAEFEASRAQARQDREGAKAAKRAAKAGNAGDGGGAEG